VMASMCSHTLLGKRGEAYGLVSQVSALRYH
jgi:hypothetical protein